LSFTSLNEPIILIWWIRKLPRLGLPLFPGY
jgi:hypothetical protein